MRINHQSWIAILVFMPLACGGVSTQEPDATVSADAAIDAAADAPIDADTCPDFLAPAGSLLFHADLCGTSLGFNPEANPTTAMLACPGTDPNPGLYGAILQPAVQNQADGCQATSPVSRLIATPVEGALVQLSTTNTLDLVDGDKLRVRVSCPGPVGCEADLQITGSLPGITELIFPEGGGAGRALVTGTEPIDIDVAIPSTLIAQDMRINFIVFPRQNGPADVLFQNPHIGRQ